MSPHEALYFYWGAELQAVRSGKWKLHLPHPYQSLDAGRRRQAGQVRAQGHCRCSLFDLDADPGETTNLAEQHPDVVSNAAWSTSSARAKISATR